MSKQYRCPEWQTCEESCPFKWVHQWSRNCYGHKNEKLMCPSCVEVEPQQESCYDEGDANWKPSQVQEKQCPECGHPVSEHKQVWVCDHIDECTCLVDELPQPTPTLREQMQGILIEGLWSDEKWFNVSNVLDALESVVKAEIDKAHQAGYDEGFKQAWEFKEATFNAKLEEIADGCLTVKCEYPSSLRQRGVIYPVEKDIRNCIHDYILKQRE